MIVSHDIAMHMVTGYLEFVFWPIYLVVDNMHKLYMYIMHKE